MATTRPLQSGLSPKLLRFMPSVRVVE